MNTQNCQCSGRSKRERRTFSEAPSCAISAHRSFVCRVDGLSVVGWHRNCARHITGTWEGEQSTVHIHVMAAIFLGGAITVLPVYLAYKRPGEALTRHVIAICQMLFSALFIDLTGGRIETHFHVFGSLAFLAAYSDWRVLITASAVVVADHVLRGIFWPVSFMVSIQLSPCAGWNTHGGSFSKTSS